jgi:type IV pilus biogenesis protein CpaD/CtpE
MKTKMILLAALIAIFSGCDKIKDATTVPIETSLKADIPVVVTATGKKSTDQTGTVNAIIFTKTQDLSLSSNADIQPYLSKIKSVDLNALVVTITGLSAGQTINSVALDVTGVGNIFTQTNISMTNNTFTPVITAATLANVAAKLTSDKKITLTVSGNASGPMTFTVSLNFDATIIAGAL